MNDKLQSLGIDIGAIKPNTTISTKSNHGTVWIKHYSLSVKDILFNIVIVGSYSGLELGEDGNRVLTLWEPVGEVPEGLIDPLDIVGEIQKAVKEVDTKQRKEKDIANALVAKQAQKFIEELWNTGLSNTIQSAYLKRKKIEPQKGVIVDQTGTLIIPMVAERSFIWNYQRITPEGDKYFLTGGRISGCYHVVSHGTSNTIFIGEGYATCVTVAMAFKEQNKRPTVVCGFNSGNLPHVCRAIKALYPDKKIIILADNDQWKEQNTGILTAQKCGEAFVTPQFDLNDEQVIKEKPTDFNDLYLMSSLGEVFRQIGQGLEKLAQEIKKREEAILAAEISDDATEISVARELINHFGDGIVACGEDIFVWEEQNGYWKHLEKGNFQSIMQIIVRLFGDGATDKKVRGAFNLFKISIQQISPDIFTQKKHLCNFKNGTLVCDGGKVWLKPHDRRDLLTYSLPLLCPLNVANDLEGGDYSPPPGLFSDLLNQVSNGDEEKKKLISQMFGALLFPLFPQIFFIIGDPHTGKSEIAKLGLNLVGFQNCSQVAPGRLYGFHLHPTIGKRVNYRLDVNTRVTLSDDTLKEVIDQVPIYIERKNRDSLQATLPPVHIYAGNALPSLGEGNAKPFERRVSLLFVTAKPPENPINDMYKKILDTEIETVLKFAISGVLGLWASQGRYVQGNDKKEAFKEWEIASSPEKDFIELLKTDGAPVYDEDGKFTGDRLFFGEGHTARPLVFAAAKKAHGNLMRKSILSKELMRAGVQLVKHNGSYVFRGIITKREPESLI